MSAMLREPGLLKQLKDMAETHAIELRAYEATVANLTRERDEAAQLVIESNRIRFEQEQRIRQLEAERVLEGYALVPIEPTIEMLDEIRWQEEITDRAMIARYKSMLAAVQQQKEGACGDERACVNCYTGIGECIATKESDK